MSERLARVAGELGADEKRVILFMAERLLMGQGQYGRLDISRDARNWLREGLNEAADLAFYLFVLLTKWDAARLPMPKPSPDAAVWREDLDAAQRELRQMRELLRAANRRAEDSGKVAKVIGSAVAWLRGGR